MLILSAFMYYAGMFERSPVSQPGQSSKNPFVIAGLVLLGLWILSSIVTWFVELKPLTKDYILGISFWGGILMFVIGLSQRPRKK